MKGGFRKATPAEIAQLRHGAGQGGGTILTNARGLSAGKPLTSDIEIAIKLRELCGAEGYRIEGGMILALRWDKDGNEHVIERFEAVAVQG